MQYNIFCSSFQKTDNILTNILRRVKFYNNTARLLLNHNIYGATILKTVGLYEGAKEQSFLLQNIVNY